LFDHLFGSKTRVKLLSLFLNNPNRPFYVREITRKVDEQINSVRRELSNLLAVGVVKSEGNNNKLYYEVNQSYQFYAPLRAIFTNAALERSELQDVSQDTEFIKKLRAAGNIKLAFETGTFTRDNSAGTDLFIMGDVNRARVSKVVIELEQELGREVNYTVMTEDDFSYRQRLNDRFLDGIMNAKKLVLIDETKAKLKPAPAQLENDMPEVSVPVEIKSS
jgi:hypothetical protein